MYRRSIVASASISNSNDSVHSYKNTDGKETKLKRLKTWLYNPRTGTCCSRTTSQWVKLIIYYIIYIAFIVGLFLVFLKGIHVLIHQASPDEPMCDKSSLMDSLHPGLGFVPNIVKSRYPIIWFSSDPNEKQPVGKYIKYMRKFLKKYKDANKGDYDNCTSDDNTKSKKPCYFDLDSLEDCGKDSYFYSNTSLCIYLKINRLKNWKPEYFQKPSDYPNQMPQSVVNEIKSSSGKKMIFVHCQGTKIWDNQFLGKISYYPQAGFPGYYFPYNGEKDYLAPLVAVKFDGVTSGIVIHVKCTCWSKNADLKLNVVNIKIFIDNTLPT